MTLSYSATDLARIRWKCRRGMLELDELLKNFFERHFTELPFPQQQAFVTLLECTDPQLFSWLMGISQPPLAESEVLVQKIRAAKLSRPL